MAITRSTGGPEVILDARRTFLHHKRDEMLKALERLKVYRATYRELSELSDRDLRDIGIHRSSIGRLAQEAANDC